MRKHFIVALVAASALCGVAAPAGAATVSVPKVGAIGSAFPYAGIQFNYLRSNPNENFVFFAFGASKANSVAYRCTNARIVDQPVPNAPAWQEIAQLGANCHRIR